MMLRRAFINVLGGFTALLVAASCSAETVTWQLGTHYDRVTPTIRVGASDDIVVSEFFWYGCGHCYTFEPMIEAWKKQLPDDVVISPSPAMWNGPMQLHAKAYYVAETLGVLDPMHTVLFKALNVERRRLNSEAALKEIFVENGVAPEDFDRAFNAFGVDSQVRQADARARSAKISGTPSLMVNGKYLITPRKAGSQANMISIAEFLIEQERNEGA